jgi:hypothetical protein
MKPVGRAAALICCVLALSGCAVYTPYASYQSYSPYAPPYAVYPAPLVVGPPPIPAFGFVGIYEGHGPRGYGREGHRWGGRGWGGRGWGGGHHP